jgi:hypothetical protein
MDSEKPFNTEDTERTQRTQRRTEEYGIWKKNRER